MKMVDFPESPPPSKVRWWIVGGTGVLLLGEDAPVPMAFPGLLRTQHTGETITRVQGTALLFYNNFRVD